MRSFMTCIGLTCALIAGSPCALATDVVIGQTAGFTGPVAEAVKEITAGAHLYIDDVNARGGINGNHIRLESLDDAFDPKRAAANVTALASKGALALFLTRGTPHTQALLQIAHDHRLPVIAPSTGAMVFHHPVDPLVFNVRAPYQREAERAVSHLLTIGITRIGIVQVDDSFGADAQVGAQSAFEKAHVQAAFIAKVDRNKPDLAVALQQAQALAPQAVLVIGTADLVLATARALRGAGNRAQLVTLSNNATNGFAKAIAEIAPGTIVSQVFPNERVLSTPLIKEAADLLAKKGQGGTLSAANVEGFAAARVLVEALRRAGHEPTSAGIVAALNSFDRVDLGGMEISYSSASHTGSQFTDLALVRADGRMIR